MKKRNRKRLTQRESILLRLIQNRNAPNKNEYIPVHEFMGEIYCEKLGKWGYVSYECSARLSEITRGNPGLIGRTTIVGRSGARYYGYRISPTATSANIIEEDLVEFYKKIRGPIASNPAPVEVLKKEEPPVPVGSTPTGEEPWWLKG